MINEVVLIKIIITINEIHIESPIAPYFINATVITEKMKHYCAKPSARLQDIQPSAAWCCANLGL